MDVRKHGNPEWQNVAPVLGAGDTANQGQDETKKKLVLFNY